MADFDVAGDTIVATVNVDHILHFALDEEQIGCDFVLPAICKNIFFPQNKDNVILLR